MNRRSLVSIATAVTCMGISAFANAQVKWDLPSAYAPANFHTENLQVFAKDVDTATSGKLKITVHPGASLFKAPEIKRAVQGGQAQLGEILLANYENEAPLFGLDGIPFLATSYPNAKRLYETQKPALEKYLAAQGMRLLYAVPWQPQGIYTKKPIDSVPDMRGTKWRAYSASTSRMAELMGMQPVTVQAAELSQAMATGVVESYISASATGVDTKTYESMKFFYDTQAWLPKNAIIVNVRSFNALEKPVQDAVLKASSDAEARGWKLSQEKDDAFKKTLAERGMKVQPPSAKFQSDLKQVGGIMLADWQKKAGADGEALIAAYKAGQSSNAAIKKGVAADGKSAATNNPVKKP